MSDIRCAAVGILRSLPPAGLVVFELARQPRSGFLKPSWVIAAVCGQRGRRCGQRGTPCGLRGSPWKLGVSSRLEAIFDLPRIQN